MVSSVKAYVAVLTTLIGVVGVAVSDSVFNGNDAANIAAAVVTAIISGLAVYRAPRFKDSPTGLDPEEKVL